MDRLSQLYHILSRKSKVPEGRTQSRQRPHVREPWRLFLCLWRGDDPTTDSEERYPPPGPHSTQAKISAETNIQAKSHDHFRRHPGRNPRFYRQLPRPHFTAAVGLPVIRLPLHLAAPHTRPHKSLRRDLSAYARA